MMIVERVDIDLVNIWMLSRVYEHHYLVEGQRYLWMKLVDQSLLDSFHCIVLVNIEMIVMEEMLDQQRHWNDLLNYPEQFE